MIYLIGDSHTIMYKGLEPTIETKHFGACTAYGLLNEHSITNSYKTLKKFILTLNPANDIVIFGFGEIDCRVLIYYKYMEYDVSLAEMIDIVVYRYFAAISFVRDIGFKIAVHGPIPAVRQGNDYNLKHYADERIRSKISKNFTIDLEHKCYLENIPFFNPHLLSYLNSRDGLIPENSLLNDKVHVDPTKVPIQEDFKKWLMEEVKFL